MRSQRIIKVNIGSGPVGKLDWINLDWGILPLLSKIPWATAILVKLGFLPASYNKPWPSNLHLHDCRKRLPFSDHSVDYIYTSHFLEHLPRYQATKLLYECRRILRSSGILRICVPDVRILAEKYVKSDHNFFIKLETTEENRQLANLTDLFIQHFYGYDSWSEPKLIQKIQRLFIRGHLWMYDFQLLKNILKTVGFNKTTRCKPGVGRVPDIKDLDIHKAGSLYIEASV